jgi:hypothetical protein
MEGNLLSMGKLFLMILSIMRSGSGTMPVPMKDLGALIGPATLTDQGTLKGEGRTCRTSRTEMHLLGSRGSMALHLARTEMHLLGSRDSMALHLARTQATCLLRHHLLRTVATIRHLHHILKVLHRITNPKCRTRRQHIHRAVHPNCKTHRQGTHRAVHRTCKTHRQGTRPKCQTSREATCPAVLLTISKVVKLATKVDLLGIREVTRFTKEATCRAALDQHTQAAIPDTKVAMHLSVKVMAILVVTMAVHQVAIINSKVKDKATGTTHVVALSP